MGDRMKQRATTLAESVHRRGLEQGIEQGMVRGRVATLLRLLEQKFGPLDEGARRRIEGAGDDELTTWTDRILLARSLAEVFDAS